MNKLYIVICAVVLALSGVSAYAMLSQKKIERISQTCQEIRTDLRRVYGQDGLARTNLGQRYDNLQRRLMDPFIRRAASNGYSVQRMRTISTQYSTTLTAFRNEYIQYHRLFDGVLAADCKNNPVNFHEQLEKMRSARANVRDNVVILKELMNEFDGIVQAMSEKTERKPR